MCEKIQPGPDWSAKWGEKMMEGSAVTEHFVYLDKGEVGAVGLGRSEQLWKRRSIQSLVAGRCADPGNEGVPPCPAVGEGFISALAFCLPAWPSFPAEGVSKGSSFSLWECWAKLGTE